MAIDFLQDKIRKLKNPSMIDLTLKPEHIPTHIVEEEGSLTASYVRAMKRGRTISGFCRRQRILVTMWFWIVLRF